VLSLDVALGALAGGSAAVCVFGVTMPNAWWLVLPVGVWCIYTADHLLDAFRLQSGSHSLRHHFHFVHRKWLLPFTLLVFAGAVGLAITKLPLEMITFGGGLAAFSILHLMIVKLVGERVSPMLFKEFGVAFAYTCGVFAFPWIAAGSPVNAEIITGLIQFMALALSNLLLYSLYEYESDRKDGQTSFVLAIGKRVGVFLISVLLIAALFISVVLLFKPEWTALRFVQGPWLLINCVHLGILLRPDFFGKSLRYRLWGDGIFIVQFVVLLIVSIYQK
jgi:hypothetical protein